MSPTVSAILFGIVWVVLSATIPAARARSSLRSTAITAGIGVLLIAALDWLGLFPRTPPNGMPLALVLATFVLIQVAFVLALLTMRRRRAAAR
jgi:4-amino-4-deoxy-L-arabinose transferase-like glycosyltransferase